MDTDESQRMYEGSIPPRVIETSSALPHQIDQEKVNEFVVGELWTIAQNRGVELAAIQDYLGDLELIPQNIDDILSGIDDFEMSQTNCQDQVGLRFGCLLAKAAILAKMNKFEIMAIQLQTALFDATNQTREVEIELIGKLAAEFPEDIIDIIYSEPEEY